MRVEAILEYKKDLEEGDGEHGVSASSRGFGIAVRRWLARVREGVEVVGSASRPPARPSSPTVVRPASRSDHQPGPRPRRSGFRCVGS